MIPIRQANKLLNVVLSQTNLNEVKAALEKVVEFLIDNHFRPNDIQFLARDETVSGRVCDLTAEVDNLTQQNDALGLLLLEHQREIEMLRRRQAVETEGRRYVTKLERRVAELEDAITKRPDPPDPPPLIASTPPEGKRRGTLTERQVEIMQGLQHLRLSTIRQLSFHLYNKPDSTTTLDDALKGLMDRGMVVRERITEKKPEWGSSMWLYLLTGQGVAELENIAP